MDFYTKVHNSHNAHHNGHNGHNGHSPHHHENHNDHNHTHNGHGPPHSRPTSNCSNQMVDIIGMVQNQIVKLEYVYFPLKLVKRQKREKKVSMQRIEDGNVSLVLDFSSVDYKRQVTAIHVGVKRTKESTNSDRSLGCVPINVDLAHVQDTKILVKVDLDSVHTYNSKKVYELDRAREELNLFHLIIDIRFVTGELLTLNTRPFKLIGRKCTGTANGKRSSTESRNTIANDNRMETSVIQAVPLVKDEEAKGDAESGYGSPSSLNSQMSASNGTHDLIEACTVVAEHIKTKFLDLDGESIINLNSVQAIKTANGDIAYHFLLHNDTETFEEGEVVGFLPSQSAPKKQVITKLTCETASQAILKGVVTRSQYIEAQKPPPGIISETIAMMGIVPVQVHGSVYANEALYASPYRPGFAVSSRNLEFKMVNKATFIGYAFSTREAKDEHSVGMVQAAVSVLQSAGYSLLQEKLRTIEDRFSEQIDEMKKNSINVRKCVCGFSIFFGLLILLASIFMWQVFMKGSAYRYYRCEVGRKEPYTSAWWKFTPYRAENLRPRVNGIEFGFDELLQKAQHYDYVQLNETGVRYYFNTDRCAYGGLYNDGDVLVRGPTVFAISGDCRSVYYYSESSGRWKRYSSTNGDVHCIPTLPISRRNVTSPPTTSSTTTQTTRNVTTSNVT